MPNTTNMRAFGLPSIYNADIERIRQQQALAQALQQQSMQEQGTQQIGGVAIKTHPLQNLSKLAQALVAAKMSKSSEDQMRSLGERRQRDFTGDISTLVQAMQGRQPSTGQPDPQELAQSADYGTPQPQPFQIPGQTPMQGLQGALPQLRSPEMQQFAGQHLLQNMLKAPNWKIEERWNPQTGMKEKVMLDMNNPMGQPMPFGGQESKPLHFADVGGGIQGMNSMTGAPVGTAMPKQMTPGERATLGWAAYQHQNPSAYQQGRLGLEQQGLGLRAQGLGLERAGLGMRAAELGYNTGQQPPIPIPGVGMPSAGAAQGGGMPQPPPYGMQPQGGMPPPALSAPTRQPYTGPLIGHPLMPPKKRAELIEAQPITAAQLQNSLQAIDRLADMAGELRNHEGLSGITGKVNQFGALDVFPSSRAARGLSKSITSQTGIMALNAMRDASKTGGAVGQVTEREWPILQQSIAALDNAQSTQDYQIALDNLRAQIAGSKARMQSAYEQTYGRFNYQRIPYVTQDRASAESRMEQSRTSGGQVRQSPQQLPSLQELQEELRRRGVQ